MTRDHTDESPCAPIWERGAALMMGKGVSKQHVATSLVAVGLRLWCEAIGPDQVAAQLDDVADGILDAIRQMSASPTN